jgi:hypothetical protein
MPYQSRNPYIQLRLLLLTCLLRTEDMYCPSFDNLLRNL